MPKAEVYGGTLSLDGWRVPISSERTPMRAGSRSGLGLAILGALLLAGCGGGNGGGSTGPGLDVTGAYQGTLTFASPAGAGQVSIRFSLVQVGSLVNGTFSNGNKDAGSFVGSVSGTVFSGTGTSTVFRIACDFEGGIQAGGATISGTFECSSGESGSFTVTRA